jgi:hypothetical protein
MTKRSVLLSVGVVAVIAGSVVAWQVSVELDPGQLPLAGVPQPMRLDPDAAGPIYVERSGPDRRQTIQDLVGLADAVLVVRLETNRTDRIDFGQPPARLSETIYDFTVLESIKGDIGVRTIVKVARLGGRGSYEPEFPRPGLGEKFVVFLKCDTDTKTYRHIYGPETIRVVNGELQPMSRVYRQLSGRDVRAFSQELRRMAAKRRE